MSITTDRQPSVEYKKAFIIKASR